MHSTLNSSIDSYLYDFQFVPPTISAHNFCPNNPTTPRSSIRLVPKHSIQQSLGQALPYQKLHNGSENSIMGACNQLTSVAVLVYIFAHPQLGHSFRVLLPAVQHTENLIASQI